MITHSTDTYEQLLTRLEDHIRRNPDLIVNSFYRTSEPMDMVGFETSDGTLYEISVPKDWVYSWYDFRKPGIERNTIEHALANTEDEMRTCAFASRNKQGK